MPSRKAKTWASILATLAVLEAGLLLLGNFLGTKIWHIGPIIQDGGVLVFPIIYVVSDLIVEIYRQKIANRILWLSVLLNSIAVVACTVVNWLPELPGANPDSLSTAFGLSARVMIASIVGFWFSGFVNNLVFEKIRQVTPSQDFWKRSLGSSVVAHIVDASLFNILAFGGRIDPPTLLQQTLSAALVGLTLETLLNPLAKCIARELKCRIIFS